MCVYDKYKYVCNCMYVAKIKMRKTRRIHGTATTAITGPCVWGVGDNDVIVC